MRKNIMFVTPLLLVTLLLTGCVTISKYDSPDGNKNVSPEYTIEETDLTNNIVFENLPKNINGWEQTEEYSGTQFQTILYKNTNQCVSVIETKPVLLPTQMDETEETLNIIQDILDYESNTQPTERKIFTIKTTEQEKISFITTTYQPKQYSIWDGEQETVFETGNNWEGYIMTRLFNTPLNPEPLDDPNYTVYPAVTIKYLCPPNMLNTTQFENFVSQIKIDTSF